MNLFCRKNAKKRGWKLPSMKKNSQLNRIFIPLMNPIEKNENYVCIFTLSILI